MRPIRRTRTLSALLLVVAFALGVLAASVQADDVFLPLLVTASTSQQTPTPSLPGTVRAVNLHFNPTRQTFYGELINETLCTVSVGQITLYLLDEAGLPLANVRGMPMISMILSGEHMPFQVSPYDPLPSWSTYTVGVAWDPIDSLTIEHAWFWLSARGDPSVTAVVRNQLPVRVQALRVGTVLTGPNGQIIGYHESWEALGPLASGNVLTATNTFYPWEWDDHILPVGCAAFAVPEQRCFYSRPQQDAEEQ